MRIGINLLYLVPEQVGGTETYGRCLLRALASLSPSHTFLVYINRECRSMSLDHSMGLQLRRCPVPARFRFLRYLWEQLILPVQLLIDRIDVIHSLGYVGPLVTHCPRVTTVHDLVFMTRGADMSYLRRTALRFFCLASIRRSAQVIVPSASTKAQIAERMPSQTGKLCLIYEAAEPEIGHQHDSWNELRQRLNIDWPYVLVAGVGCPHKNAVRVVQAFLRLPSTTPHHLALTGEPEDELRNFVSSLPPDVQARIHLVGYLTRTDFDALLRHAEILVHASLYDGFGIPILEAQSRGVPVVCSDRYSLPEIAGDAAVLCDPTSLADLTEAISSVIFGAEMASDLRVRGRHNAKRFSWELAASHTIQVYEGLGGYAAPSTQTARP